VNDLNLTDPHGIRSRRIALDWTERELGRPACVPYQRVQALERPSPTGKPRYSRYLARILHALAEGEGHPAPAAPDIRSVVTPAVGEAQRMNVSVGERWERFVERIVKSGRYGSASEVVQEGLRLVEEREAKLAALREKIDASIAAGEEAPGDQLDTAIAVQAPELRHPR
jgi:antitoxin ParD1/3/4